MIEHIYIAKFKYGEPYLAKVKVKSETPKTFPVDSHENLLGYSWPGRRVLKSQAGVFDSMAGALRYLVDKGNEYVRQRELEAAKGRSSVAMLEQMLEQGEGVKAMNTTDALGTILILIIVFGIPLWNAQRGRQ